MELALWQDNNSLAEIKKLFAPNLNENEFQTFIGIGKSTGLNPFLREIWAVKYGSQGANIFIGRDGYRKSAQANKDYDYHIADAVYSNDKFEVSNGEIKHTYNFTNRGQLVGAYCQVKRKGSSKAMFNFVELKEYYLGNKDENGKIKKRYDTYKKEYVDMGPTLWDTKPATMIKKVAEAQGLRGTFQELFAGTYDESEDWNKPTSSIETKKAELTVEEKQEIYSRCYELIISSKNLDELKANYQEIQKDLVKLDKTSIQEITEIKDNMKNGFSEKEEKKKKDPK